jgi:hypothetical protein
MSSTTKEGFVNVKVIESRNRLRGNPPEAAKIESALREWLNDNPNASIEHVAQTPISVAGVYGETTTLLVTIFYRD